MVKDILDSNPKYVEIGLTPEMAETIQDCKNKGLLYGIFPTTGDSMTCEDKEKSIPSGAKVFAVETRYKRGKLSLGLVPTNKPLLIMGIDPEGKPFRMCKMIAFQDYVQDRFLLRSYNPAHKDAWIPIHYIDKIFEVKQIISEDF